MALVRLHGKPLRQIISTTVTLLILLVSVVSSQNNKYLSVASGKSKFVQAETDQVIRFMGYNTEIHDVESDGYIIRINRMINPLADSQQVKRTILFLHGLSTNTISNWLGFAEFVKPKRPNETFSYSPDIYEEFVTGEKWGRATNKKDKLTHTGLSRMCWPCMFSDNNYDVWLMDDRGTTKASRRVSPKRHDLLWRKNYWSFGLDEVSLVDLPNVIDHVIRMTKRKKLAYVGLSKGSTHMFALLSKKSQYANKLTAFVAMAPFVYGPVRGLADGLRVLQPIMNSWHGTFIATITANIFSITLPIFCTILNGVCRSFLTAIAGPDTSRSCIFTDVNLAHVFITTSHKTITQLGQAIETGRLAMYDYEDEVKNYRLYGSKNPPEYNMSEITFDKIILVRSEGNDYLSTTKAHKKLKRNLGAPIFKDIVLPPNYNHFSIPTHKDVFLDAMVPVMRAVNEAYLR